MKVCIVGSGFAGLCTAKVLRAFGHHITLFEKEPDIGGVWSAARRYPGLTTQNTRSTYAFSDYPYPSSYPEWPTGAQVQRYLQGYARHFRLTPHIHLHNEVIGACRQADGWQVYTRHANGSEASESFDYLVVCNGVFSQAFLPDYPGTERFIAAGGRLCHTSTFLDLDEIAGKHVLVIGYGKSSCDVAQAVAGRAASTTVVARQLLWKVPKRLLNLLNYKYLLLTRLGESLFPYIQAHGFERFLHGTGKPLRDAMLRLVQWIVIRQCRLRQLELVPMQPFESIARSTISLVTDGFFENVAAGRIGVARYASIARLLTQGNTCYASLSDGRVLPADVVICGTGWQQCVPFLDEEIMQRVSDAEGNFRLYRGIVPVGVTGLAFNGYNSSLFSQLNAEMGALWLADLMSGRLSLPADEEQQRSISTYLTWQQQRTDGQHMKGTSVIPFSIHHIDQLLQDMQLPLSCGVRLKQWLWPIDPADFAVVMHRLIERHHAGSASLSAGSSDRALPTA